MATRNTLEVLKQCFEEVVPRHDKRTTIAPLSFVVCLVYTYLGDSKTFSLEAIRRGMMHHLKTRISRSAFWERLARHRLQTLLQGVVAQLMGTLTTSALIGEQLLARLGVSRIELVDSSSITLWDGAKQAYPGTRTTAGIKWHLALDVLSGGMTWWRLTPTATHDRKCFPDVASLRGKLVIFDLGYWDYGLLIAIEAAGGFFLSRLKSTAVIRIQAVVQGLSKKYIGQDLLALPLSGHRNRLIEVLIEKGHHGHMLRCRVIGFWNPAEGSYHWYITNLTAAAYLMYPLYRLRWQIELIFKACKNSLNANQITSNDTSIIQSLLLASLVAHLSTATILHGGLAQLDEEQQLAISFQRIAKVAVVLAQDFVHFLLNASRHYFFQLVDQIKLFAPELFDPNYKHRETTLMRLNRRLETGPNPEHLCTAAMLEPYVPHENFPDDFTGLLHVDEETLTQDLTELEKRGFTVKLHTAGDRAVRVSLNAIEKAHAASGRSDLRHELSHAGFVAPTDIPRFQQLNAVADLSPYVWFPSPIIQSVLDAVGERGKRYWPNRDLLETGAPMLAGSDWPAAVPSLDPWIGIEAMVTRRDPRGETPGALWPEQALSLEQTLRIFTIEGAKALRLEAETGSLKVGKSADMIVLGHNLFSIAPDALADTRVNMTLFTGKLVHQK